MAGKNSVARNLLFVAIAVVLLFGVAAVSYSLGARHAGAWLAGPSFQNHGMLRGLFVGGFGDFDQGKPSDEGGIDRGRFGIQINDRQMGHGRWAGVAHMVLRLAIGAVLFGMLVMGTIAFFRTGGWRPASASTTQTSRRKRS